MFRKTIYGMLVVILSLMSPLSVLAAAPAEGNVVEGQSVPGVALGDSRAQVESAFGQPESCRNLSYYDGRVGLNGICDFSVEGGGKVSVYYLAPDGGPAQDSADDQATAVGWTEQVSGWVTTAGVNTTLARNNPEAVIAAYPDAEVTSNQFGAIFQVKDWEQGITISWDYDIFLGLTQVRMSISYPRTAPPPREPLTTVKDIQLSVSKIKGVRKVIALVRVQDDRTFGAEGANVTADWTFPDGRTMTVEDLTSSSGYAYFEINRADRGLYTLTVTNVELADHRFDRENSVLSATIQVK
jgi:hypothetical protein